MTYKLGPSAESFKATLSFSHPIPNMKLILSVILGLAFFFIGHVNAHFNFSIVPPPPVVMEDITTFGFNGTADNCKSNVTDLTRLLSFVCSGKKVHQASINNDATNYTIANNTLPVASNCQVHVSSFSRVHIICVLLPFHADGLFSWPLRNAMRPPQSHLI